MVPYYAVYQSGAEKWKRSIWSSVAIKVSVVNIQTAGTATRARAHMGSRADSASTAHAAQYPPPRNAAVSGGLIVQAKSVCVRSDKIKSGTPAAKTRPAAVYSIRRMAG